MSDNYKQPDPVSGWVFCRFRRDPRTGKVLDAHDYGYECWRFPKRK